ncbi:heme exporter protein CcmD [Paeniroseomonas aquatica]|uniref:Heme exporter protein D n=1 Tax=Paeniroseomonas aquatica TaxID=373043 RepID=A0ABT8AFZ8_9PROT|nr:heme exporter protein CcmD [Paeniroseomonas aquatica]MDN3568684.1 heme exporter protein CcmD [Paeniroseomonas aquatica]
MSTHWVHITASYGLVVGGFLALGIATLVRHAAAKRRLAQLDTRAGRGRERKPA